MKALTALVGLGVVLMAAVLLRRRPEAWREWSEPEDGIQPPDPRPVAIMMGPLTTTASTAPVPFWTVAPQPVTIPIAPIAPMLTWTVSPDGPITMRRQAH